MEYDHRLVSSAALSMNGRIPRAATTYGMTRHADASKAGNRNMSNGLAMKSYLPVEYRTPTQNSERVMPTIPANNNKAACIARKTRGRYLWVHASRTPHIIASSRNTTTFLMQSSQGMP